MYLNLVLEYIPETVYKVARHYSKSKQTIPISFIKVSEFNFFICTGEAWLCTETVGYRQLAGMNELHLHYNIKS